MGMSLGMGLHDAVQVRELAGFADSPYLSLPPTWEPSMVTALSL